MKIRINSQKAFLCFGIAVFFINSVFRNSIYAFTGINLPGMVGTLNLIAIIALFYLIFHHGIKKTKGNFILLLVIMLYVFLTAISNFRSVSEVSQYVLWGSILPGMLVSLMDSEKIQWDSFFRSFLKSVNIILILVFLLGIADYFLGGVINSFLANYMSDENWAMMIRRENEVYGFRMCTILGAPLMNAFYALALLVMNTVYAKKYKKWLIPVAVLYGVTMMTIFLTGSRTALVLGVAYIAFSELAGKWGILRIIFLVGVFIILINTPVFQETVGNRLQIGFMNESDLRYKLFSMFMDNKFGKIKWFGGGGYNYSRYLTSSLSSVKSNFEYPFLMFAFDYGIISTVFYYIIFCVVPLIKFVREKKFIIVSSYIVLFAFLQTCNIVAQFYDFNMAMGFIIALFTGISRDDKIYLGEK